MISGTGVSGTGVSGTGVSGIGVSGTVASGTVVSGKARLVESREVAPQVRHFTFEFPHVEQFSFDPGQFVSFYYPLEDKTITRAYSIASVPDRNRFEVCLNLVEQGRFSPFLFSMQPGDEVAAKGPFGTFVWREPRRDSILVATGTGITPYRGMLQKMLPSGAERVTLVYGARRPENLIYHSEFEAMAQQFSQFEYWPTLSRAEESWMGRRGYVQGHVRELLGERRDVDVYICGMKAMVDDLRGELKEFGLDRKQIIYEKYD